jgi:hypothetical protein
MTRKTKLTWLTLLLAATPVHAESTRAAMQEFGLIGSWSVDCSLDLTQACATTRRCFGRITFSAPIQGTATREIIAPPVAGNNQSKQSWNIVSASRVSADKIRLLLKGDLTMNGKPVEMKGRPSYMFPMGEEEWEMVYIKKEDKLQVWVSQRTDGGKISVSNGEQMTPSSSWSEDQGPVKQWESAGKPGPLLERCIN